MLSLTERNAAFAKERQWPFADYWQPELKNRYFCPPPSIARTLFHWIFFAESALPSLCCPSDSRSEKSSRNICFFVYSKFASQRVFVHRGEVWWWVHPRVIMEANGHLSASFQSSSGFQTGGHAFIPRSLIRPVPMASAPPASATFKSRFLPKHQKSFESDRASASPDRSISAARPGAGAASFGLTKFQPRSWYQNRWLKISDWPAALLFMHKEPYKWNSQPTLTNAV